MLRMISCESRPKYFTFPISAHGSGFDASQERYQIARDCSGWEYFKGKPSFQSHKDVLRTRFVNMSRVVAKILGCFLGFRRAILMRCALSILILSLLEQVFV